MSPLPVVAIGGIKAHNAAPCIDAGAQGLAIVSGIFAADDIAGATREFLAIADDRLRAAGRDVDGFTKHTIY